MLQVLIHVKFRLFGHDFGSVSEAADIHPLEGTVTIVPEAPAVLNNPIYAFSKFGVTVQVAFNADALDNAGFVGPAPSA